MVSRDSPTIGEIYGPGAERREALAAYIDSLIDDTAKVVAEKLRSEIELADQLIEMLGGYSSVDGDYLVMARPPREAA